MSVLMEQVVTVEMWSQEQDEAETTSSDDERLSSTIEEAEEAATWLIDVGLGDIVDSLLDTNSAIINEKLWSSMSHREGFSRSQMDTVKRRVETVRTNVKGRRHQRPDCRDIFRSPQQTQSDESNSSRSRSATPECPELLDSERLKTSMENLLNPVDWMDKAPPIPSVVVKADYLSNDRSLSTQIARRKARRAKLTVDHLPTKNVVAKDRRSNFFGLTSRDHVAGHERELGVEIVKYKSTGTLSPSTGLHHRSNYFSNSSAISPVPSRPSNKKVGVSCYDDLNEAQRKKSRQLALLELTVLMDAQGLETRKRNIRKVKQPRMKSDAAVYGIPLEKLVEKDRLINAATKTPVIVHTLIDVLRCRHLDEEGLLRVPGSQQKMGALQKWIESRWKSNVSDAEDLVAVTAVLEQVSSHDLAGLLKHFLRQLPESLFTVDLVNLFAQVADIAAVELQLKALSLLVLQLPEANYHTLHLLLHFLSDVVAHQSTNLMSAVNVATMLGPNLFPLQLAKRKRKNAIDTLSDGVAYTAKANAVTQLLLIHRERIFVIPKEVMTQLLMF